MQQSPPGKIAKRSELSNAQITLKHLRELVVSFEFFVFATTFALMLLETTRANLFGSETGESLVAALSFRPALPLTTQSISFLSYPLVHLGWSHWLSSAPLWFFLGRWLKPRIPGAGLSKWLIEILIYGAGTVLVASSYRLPFAPEAVEADRVLGLSALTLMQLGVLSSLRPHLIVWALLVAVGFSLIFFAPASALSNWGHLAGLVIGLAIGLVIRAWLRLKCENSSAAS